MSWVIDTCVVLDVLVNDLEFGLKSAGLLEERLHEGLTICPITMVELAPAFGGNSNEQKRFLDLAGISYRTEWMLADTEAAQLGWYRHVLARRTGSHAKRPIADVLIGSFASQRSGLITRNSKHFISAFPKLRILDPSA